MTEGLDPQQRKTDLFAPLVCPDCQKSAYDVNMGWLSMADHIEPEMVRRSDPNALEPKSGATLDCPYCGSPLGVPVIYPVLGGGFTVRFTFLTKAGVTS